jgi:hypothetical protein
VRSHEPKLYSIRVKGHLGATCLAAFPEMVSQQSSPSSRLGLELIEIRRLLPNPESAEISKRFTS